MNKAGKMKYTTKEACPLLIKHEEKITDSYQKVLSNARFTIWLSIPYVVYLTLCTIVTESGAYFNDILAVFFPLVFYVVFLLSISVIHSWTIDKANSDSEYKIAVDGANLSHIYAVFLAATALYFFVSAIIYLLITANWKTTIAEQGGLSLKMTIISLTSYVGFVVSLEDLFNKKEYPKFGKIFLKPFIKLKMHRGFIWIGTLVIIVLVLASVFVWVWLGLWIVFFAFLGILYLLNFHRKKRLREFSFQMHEIIATHDVLIFQLGADYVVKKYIGESLKKCQIKITVEKEDVVFTQKFDTIIVLNSLHKNEQFLHELEKIKEILKDNGTIIDPFVTKNKKRSFLSSWLGIPNTCSNEFNVDEYFKCTW